MKTNSDTTTRLYIGLDVHKEQTSVAVHVPDEKDEAIRDLCRARVDAVDDLRRAKTRLLGLLRRLGYNYSGETHWTEAHKRYLRELHLPFPAHRVILEELLCQVDQLAERIARLETQMELLYRDWQRKPVVDAVMALKGFPIIAAMVIVSEIGDFTRFAHPRQLMSYLGLTPGEYSSGGKQKQGGITHRLHLGARDQAPGKARRTNKPVQQLTNTLKPAG